MIVYKGHCFGSVSYTHLDVYKRQGVYQRVVDRASLRSERYIANEAEVGIIITTLKGEILAMDKHAKEIGELEQWHIPCIS